MSDTTPANVRALVDKFAEEFTDTEISQMIDLAKIIVSKDAPNATGDEEELLQRYMTAHLLVRKKAMKYTGRGVSNMSVGRINLNRSTPEDLAKSKQLYDEYLEILRRMTSRVGFGKTNYPIQRSTSVVGDYYGVQDI